MSDTEQATPRNRGGDTFPSNTTDAAWERQPHSQYVQYGMDQGVTGTLVIY